MKGARSSSISTARGEIIDWFMSQPGVFIHKSVPYATECRIIQNQFALITKILNRNALSVESTIKDEPFLNVNARDEVG